MKASPVIVIGGTGVFWRYIVDELLTSSTAFKVTVAARHRQAFERQFPRPLASLNFAAVDVWNGASVENALRGHEIVILAAGPFQNLPVTVAATAAKLGIHYLDICDDPVYMEKMPSLKPAFVAAGKICLSGLSSLPGISLPLALLLAERFDAIEKISVGLAIGNKNQKGRGAVMSAIGNLARPVMVIRNGRCVQIKSWAEREIFPFPPPLGPIPAYSFNSPEPMLFPGYFKFSELTVKVGFESFYARVGFLAFKKLADLGLQKWSEALIAALFPLFSLSHRFGSEYGSVTVVMDGLKNGGALKLRAAIVGKAKGQRMASLPCVIAAESLANGECNASAVLDLGRWMSPEIFLDKLVKRGFGLAIEEIP